MIAAARADKTVAVGTAHGNGIRRANSSSFGNGLRGGEASLERNDDENVRPAPKCRARSVGHLKELKVDIVRSAHVCGKIGGGHFVVRFRSVVLVMVLFSNNAEANK